MYEQITTEMCPYCGGVVRQGAAVCRHCERDLRSFRRPEQASMWVREALYDAATGLPNQVLLMDRLQTELRRARRRGESVALVAIELGALHTLDMSGSARDRHAAYRSFADRLTAVVRADDTVARGVECHFFVLASLGENPRGVTILQNRLGRALASRLLCSSGMIETAPSLGVAVHPDTGLDATALVSAALEALRLGGTHAGSRVSGAAPTATPLRTSLSF